MNPPIADIIHVPKATFRRVSEAELRRNNALLGVTRDLTFAWASVPARMTLSPLPAHSNAAGWLRVQLDDHSVDLGLPALPEPSSLSPAFAGIEIAQLPEDLLLGVLEVWLEEPLAALRRHGIAAQLTGWQLSAPLTPPACAWRISRGTEDTFLTGTLHAEPAALTHLSNLVGRAQTAFRTSADALPCRISVAVARLSLPLSATRSVAVGDVLLLPVSRAHWSAGGCDLWSGDRLIAHAVRQNATIKISKMNASSPAPAPNLQNVAIDELPVQLLFDVGQTELNVGQLRTIAAGYTFELPAAPERIVTIRANGREIGQAELVDLGDKLGARVVTWSLT